MNTADKNISAQPMKAQSHDEQSSHTSSHIARTQSTYPPHHILQNHINQVLIDDSEDQKINALTV